jgi:hypothetical protein
LRLLVANGITSARDMGGGWEHFDQIKRWREEIRKGSRIGPRFFMAGSLLDGPGSAWSHAAIISGPDEGRVAVQRLKDQGADTTPSRCSIARRPASEAIRNVSPQSLRRDG